MNWRIIVSIAKKDIVDSLRNSSLLGMLMLPIGLSVILHFTNPILNPELTTISVLVYDPESSRLVAQLRTNNSLLILDAPSNNAVTKEMEQEGVIGGIIVPE